MKGKVPLDFLKSNVGLKGIHPLMGFIDDQQIPGQVCHPLELVVAPTHIG